MKVVLLTESPGSTYMVNAGLSNKFELVRACLLIPFLL